MDDGKLPSEYDVIILGTGMTECILAAAFARIGHKVLHLDRNDYYSGDWATFHFKALRDWINGTSDKLKATETVDTDSILNEGEKLIALNVESDTITKVIEQCFIKKTIEPPLAVECSDTIVTSADKTTAELGEEPDHVESKQLTDAKVDSESADGDTATKVDSDSTPADNSDKLDDEPRSPPQTHASVKTAPAKSSPESQEWSMDKLERLWRKFNIDIMPKILYSRGPLVELLISSDIAKYCEFRSITRILTELRGAIQQVPCSRSDVFSSKQVNMIEKRMLMKLLTFCLDYENHPEEYQGYEDKAFTEFLKSKKLTANVLHYVKSAIAMATDTTSTLEGLQSTQKFLRSLGRYGNTAFLWPMYGSGEIPQCFCRMCAVFGGVYCLRRTGQSVIVDADNKVQGIVDTEGQRLTAKWLVMEASYASEALLPARSPPQKISRAILLTDNTIFPDSKQHITLMSVPPPEGGSSPVTLYELSALSMACPEGLYVVQLIYKSSSDDAQSDLGPAITRLFDWDPNVTGDEVRTTSTPDTTTKPRVLWSLFFSVTDHSDLVTPGDGLPDNVHIVGGPSADLDMDLAISQARELFSLLCPGEEFIPKAPNPEDIIFEGMEGTGEEGGGFAADGENTGEGENTESKEEGENTEERESKEQGENAGEGESKGEGEIIEKEEGGTKVLSSKNEDSNNERQEENIQAAVVIKEGDKSSGSAEQGTGAEP